jgi:hypothetical protein
MHGGMINKLSRSFNRMNRKRFADGKRKERLLGGSKDWRKLQTTHPGRTWQFMRLSILRNMQLLSQLLLTLHSNV